MIKGNLLNTTNNYIKYNVDIDENNPINYGTGYEYFILYEPIPDPDLDQRYFTYHKNETPVNQAHPLYPQFKKWLIEHVYTKKPTVDILFELSKARMFANSTWRDADSDTIAQGLIQKQLKNIPLENYEEAIMTDYVAKTTHLIANINHEANLKDQILLDQEPNMDSGWDVNQ